MAVIATYVHVCACTQLTLICHIPLSCHVWQPHTHTYFLPSLLTYLLTPWCRVLLEKLTGLQLVKKFPTFHRTRMFITTLTSFHHLSLSWASPIQSIYPHPTSWRSILILATHLRLGLPSGLLPPHTHIHARNEMPPSFRFTPPPVIDPHIYTRIVGRVAQ